ncbi:MAG: UbiA-like polyprenyltransferase [Phycisphaerae bacterium]|jgi:4-hydroxybenzoate polyprenyltransferase
MPGIGTNLRTWAEMIKIGHTVFALPFALLATFLAARPQRPTAVQLILILLAMAAARSAAMTFNRLADAVYDAQNPRTAGRALPRGLIGRRAAWVFFMLCAAAFVLVCAGFWWTQRNVWPLVFCGPVLVVLCGYSYTKRFTQWSHLVLGAGIALAPVAAWVAINPATLGAPAVLLLVVVSCWIGGFDIIYACQDVNFDRRSGLLSLPARLGIGSALWVARGLHAITASALVAVGITAGLGVVYYVGVACVAVLLVVENALVHPGDLSRVNVAFFTVNGVVGLVLGILGVLDILLR